MHEEHVMLENYVEHEVHEELWKNDWFSPIEHYKFTKTDLTISFLP